MNFGLIIVGDEILSGKRQDKHLPKVIDLLSARGLSLAWARYVGDDPARIAGDLRDAFAGAARDGDMVFCCGGIGATPDDHTRQSAGHALGRPVVLHPEAKALIQQRMREVAAEQGHPYDPDRDDNVHRLNMGVFPEGAEIIPNPYNRIPGFSVAAGEGAVWFVPGFPVMAWPMIEWVLDHRLAHLHVADGRPQEQSVIVFGAMEATLTPLMQEIEARFAGIKVFSLPSVDHPEWGRHIELGVKGSGPDVATAYRHLLDGLHSHGAKLGPELVR
jgi:molybdopterin-biosynthesis enzyme MoeA-like protein